MKKRLLSLLLVIVMVVGMLPTMASAAGTPVTSDWKNFRNSDANMAITDVALPANPETTLVKWVKKLDDNYPNVPIIVDDALVTIGGTTIYKLDLQTGTPLATGTLVAAPSWGYTPPIYADGLIICALADGRLQAVDAKTLDSVWVYQDDLQGQANSPVAYSDGYVYTGFWNGESQNANFVCVNIEDGTKVWSKTVMGGFYWAGAVVIGNAVIVGTDDGAAEGTVGTSHLYSWNKLTGEQLSDLTLTDAGDQRSSIAYSAEKGRVYFTSKGGYINSAAVDASTGALSDLKSVNISGQTTSTPVVYGDKMYFCAGGGVATGGGSGSFVVADADSLTVQYTVALKAYPQASVLLSTAHEEAEGKLYFYTTYNGKPGGISLIKVDPTKSTADGAELVELYNAAGYEEYCIASPICGPDGTIYYKNDSRYLIALHTSEVCLTGLTSDVGQWDSEFNRDDDAYILNVPTGTQSVTFTAAPSIGNTVTINGSAATEPVILTDGVATAEIVVTNGVNSKTYTVNIRTMDNNASLSSIKIYDSSDTDCLELAPTFDSNEQFYTVTTMPDNKVNLAFTPASEKASVQVYGLADYSNDSYKIADYVTRELWASDNKTTIESADVSQATVIRVMVTAEDGTQKNYYIVASTASGSEDAARKMAALKVAEPVITKITQIGFVTLESKNEIEAVRDAYNTLTEEQKALVYNAKELTRAEAEYVVLKTMWETYSTDPAVDSWLPVILARYPGFFESLDATALENANEAYYAAVEDYVKENINAETIKLSSSIEHSRLILALTALGYDVTDVGGYNLLTGLANKEFVTADGVKGAALALLAINSHDYELPEMTSGETQNSVKVMYTYLKDNALRDGGWSSEGSTADPEITGFVLQALAPYWNISRYNAIYNKINSANNAMSEIYWENGEFGSAEGNANMLSALWSLYHYRMKAGDVDAAVSILPTRFDYFDFDWNGDGDYLLDYVLAYYTADASGFTHVPGGDYDQNASEWALLALINHDRCSAGMNALFDMTDVTVSNRNRDAAQSVTDLINAIGDVTLESAEAIEAARAAYDALTDAQEKYVTVYELLTNAEEKLAQLQAAAADQTAADAVIAKINAIGTVTLDSRAAIAEARAAYEALSPAQKNKVSNYYVLLSAEATLEYLKDENTKNPIDIFVTISNKGTVVMAQKKITVTDVNDNGIFDVDDALYAAHEAAYEGGAAAGYSTYVSQYGLGIGKLWGDTSGSFGYWLNNVSCWSLEDVVTEGSYLTAFVYSDGTTWSDSYSKFEKNTYSGDTDGITVKLDKAGYDADWNTVFSAHSCATVTVFDANMKAVNATVTDNGDGTYTLTGLAEGSYYVVATDAEPLLVPAVAALTVVKSADQIAAEAVEAKITAIGTVTKDSKTAIEAARAAYNALTPDQKSLVTNYEALTTAEAALKALQDAEKDPNNPQTGDNTNIVLYSSLMVGSAACLAVILLMQKKRRTY